MNYNIKRLDLSETKTVYDLYMKRDFPLSEIKPFSLISRLYEAGLNVTYCLYQAEEQMPSAYAIFEKPSRESKVWLLDFLAVDSEKKGQGIGSLFLKLLAEELKKDKIEALLIEIERIDEAEDEAQRLIREKRKSFYLKNGLEETGIFTVADENVGYEILCLPLQDATLEKSICEYIGQIYETIFEPGTYKIDNIG